jgi:2-methylcitrate dehydratase PrpD
LAKRVSVNVDEGFEAQFPDAAPARVTVITSDRSRTATVTNPRGHWSRPLSETERWEKFSTLVAEPRVAEVWWDRLAKLHEIPDCSTLLEVN